MDRQEPMNSLNARVKINISENRADLTRPKNTLVPEQACNVKTMHILMCNPNTMLIQCLQSNASVMLAQSTMQCLHNASSLIESGQ